MSIEGYDLNKVRQFYKLTKKELLHTKHLFLYTNPVSQNSRFKA